ncbi:MAG: antibiotic biosynthesis monooxygenase [Rhodospirillales bacterium]
MWAVLFEVTPKADRWDEYLAHAASLRPELLRIDGFLDNRRFASRTRPGTLLSLSYWRDQAALIVWRSHGLHRDVQAAGRSHVFEDYRLRVGEAVADATNATRCVSIVETPTVGPPSGAKEWDMFDGVTVPGATAMLLTWNDAASMAAWTEAGGERRTDIAIARDYGMRDRHEAP